MLLFKPVGPVIYQKRCGLAVLLFKLLWLRSVRKKRNEMEYLFLLKKWEPLHFNVFLQIVSAFSSDVFFLHNIFHIICVCGYSSFVCLLICLRPSSALHPNFFPSAANYIFLASYAFLWRDESIEGIEGDTWNPYLCPTPAHLKSTTGPFCDNQYLTPPNIIWRELCVDRSFQGCPFPTLTATLAPCYSPRSHGGHHDSAPCAHTDWWVLRRGFLEWSGHGTHDNNTSPDGPNLIYFPSFLQCWLLSVAPSSLAIKRRARHPSVFAKW